MFEQALKVIADYPVIVIHRHSNPDGDAMGSQIGLKKIIEANYPDKKVYAVGDAAGRYAFMADSTMDEIPDSVYDGALAIILDTSARKLISDERYVRAAMTLRMDHHIFCEKIAEVEVVDTGCESCCGLIADFCQTMGLTLPAEAATALYTGMVTDSGRFMYEGVTGDAMRMAGLMLDAGVDIQWLYANLYLKDFDSLKFTAYIYEHMSVTENGVAWLLVDKAMQEKFGLSMEGASAAISSLSGIRGCLCWIAFIETGDEDGAIRVRLRSRFATINQIAECYHGGGHACASGATVYSQEEMQALLRDADAHIKEYKENNDGWL